MILLLCSALNMLWLICIVQIVVDCAFWLYTCTFHLSTLWHRTHTFAQGCNNPAFIAQATPRAGVSEKSFKHVRPPYTSVINCLTPRHLTSQCLTPTVHKDCHNSNIYWPCLITDYYSYLYICKCSHWLVQQGREGVGQGLLDWSCFFSCTPCWESSRNCFWGKQILFYVNSNF